MQDPEVYLDAIGVQLDCAVHPGRPAILDARHRVRLNHEVFFVSDLDAREEFLREPLRYCGTLTDPVSGERFTPTPDSPRLEHSGTTFILSSRETLDAFRAEPRRFAPPDGEMSGG